MEKHGTAIEAYKYYAELEGNQHIASEFALKKIIDIIINNKIKNILEFGLGIGSISYCVLEHFEKNKKEINYIGTEANEFCLSVLPKYLKSHFGKVQIFDEVSKVSNDKNFDLIIIDGYDQNLLKIKKLISSRGIVIIEGDRIPQLNLIRNNFPNSLYTRLISNYKNPKYGPFPQSDWCGGIQLVFVNPTFSQKANFIYYKIIATIRYRLRAIKK